MSDTSVAGERSPKKIDGKITDDDIERQRRQIGVPQFTHAQAFNWAVSGDVIRHYAFGFVGDDNPLWHDPEYGKTTRWRGQIAPPLFASSTGLNETPKPTPETKALFKGLYRGVGRYNVGTNWSFFMPTASRCRLRPKAQALRLSVRGSWSRIPSACDPIELSSASAGAEKPSTCFKP